MIRRPFLYLVPVVAADRGFGAGLSELRVAQIPCLCRVEDTRVDGDRGVGAEVRRGREAVREVVGDRVLEVEGRQAEDLVERAVHAQNGGVSVRDIAALRPR